MDTHQEIIIDYLKTKPCSWLPASLISEKTEIHASRVTNIMTKLRRRGHVICRMMKKPYSNSACYHYQIKEL